MPFVKAGYWVLAALAAAGWIVFLLAEVALIAGDTRIVIWLAETFDRFGSYASWLGVLLFGAFTMVIAFLGLHRWRTTFRSFWVAMRGAPKWLVMAMIATFLFLVIRLVWTQFVSPTPFVPNISLFSAPLMSSALALACCSFVSAARLGLGTQYCENGHALGRDMPQCSLCDAPARGVLL